MNGDLEKEWTESRGMVANVVGAVTTVAALAGVSIDAGLQNELTLSGALVLMLISHVVGLIGRLRATRGVRSFLGMKGG